MGSRKGESNDSIYERLPKPKEVAKLKNRQSRSILSGRLSRREIRVSYGEDSSNENLYIPCG